MKESLAGDNGRGGGRRSVVQEVDQNADNPARCTGASGQHRAESDVDADRDVCKWPLTSSLQTVELQRVSDARAVFFSFWRV